MDRYLTMFVYFLIRDVLHAAVAPITSFEKRNSSKTYSRSPWLGRKPVFVSEQVLRFNKLYVIIWLWNMVLKTNLTLTIIFW